MKRIGFTGGPCGGKSTLLNYFAKKFPIIEETARPILDQYRGASKELVAHRIYEVQKQEELALESLNASHVFLDRTLVDTVAYPALHGIELKTNYQQDLYQNRYDYVFLLEVAPKELYKQDGVRKESYEEALRIQQHLHNIYRFFGYEPIVLPFNSVEERIETINRIIDYTEEKQYG